MPRPEARQWKRKTTIQLTVLWLGAATVALLAPVDAGAYRMIRNSSTGRVTTGTGVSCSDAIGFAHWTTAAISWRLNPTNQGGKSGMETAFRNALASWTNVSPASYTLGYAGTTSQGFATDGANTAVWGTNAGCTGSCLALTALVLAPGQVITEADFLLNNAVIWNANGSDYDAQAIMAHELGHSLGIHHTDLTKQRRDRPTMYALYFGTEGRSLSSDDQAALNCAYSRYPPASSGPIALTAVEGSDEGGHPLHLVARARSESATLRFALPSAEPVKLDVFDVAGRHLATLLDEWRGPGEHEVVWEGSTRTGRARPGVYFARVLTPEAKATTTVVLTR